MKPIEFLLVSAGFWTFLGLASLPAQKAISTPLLPATSQVVLGVVEENATFSPNGNDRHYTEGLKLSFTSGPLGENSIWSAPSRWLANNLFLFDRRTREVDNRLEWTVVGQSFFTPEDHRISDPSLSDRPYAGWLYTGLDLIQDYNAQQLTSLEILAGVVGPWALGEQVQNNVHRFFNQQPAKGWDHQLTNEFGFAISWERKWRFNHELGNEYSWEIIPDAGITAGNVFTFGEAGLLFRWGRGLKADWGPEMIRPGYSGTSYFSGDRAKVRLGWDFYIGTQGRVVARNIFLDGNTFADSRSVDKEPVVADLLLGVELFTVEGLRLGFSLVARTPEFRQQRGMDNFGSINAKYSF
jgi:lipid A 3-O-deacylase